MDSKTNNNLATVPENDPLEDGYTKVTISDLNLMVSAVDVESIKHLAVPTPKNEISRLKILRETNLLNSNYSQETFDLIANIAKRHFKSPYSFITLIDANRQWYKSRTGNSNLFDTPRDDSFSTYAILEDSPEVFVVPNTDENELFVNNPLVTGPPYFRFYAGAAIQVNDVKIGTVCIFDNIPRYNFTEEDGKVLKGLADLIGSLAEFRRYDFLSSFLERSKIFLCAFQSVHHSLHSIYSVFLNMTKHYEVLRDHYYHLSSAPTTSPQEFKVFLLDTVSQLEQKIMHFQTNLDYVNEIIDISLKTIQRLSWMTPIENQSYNTQSSENSYIHGGIRKKSSSFLHQTIPMDINNCIHDLMSIIKLMNIDCPLNWSLSNSKVSHPLASGHKIYSHPDVFVFVTIGIMTILKNKYSFSSIIIGVENNPIDYMLEYLRMTENHKVASSKITTPRDHRTNSNSDKNKANTLASAHSPIAPNSSNLTPRPHTLTSNITMPHSDCHEGYYVITIELTALDLYETWTIDDLSYHLYSFRQMLLLVTGIFVLKTHENLKNKFLLIIKIPFRSYSQNNSEEFDQPIIPEKSFSTPMYREYKPNQSEIDILNSLSPSNIPLKKDDPQESLREPELPLFDDEKNTFSSISNPSSHDNTLSHVHLNIHIPKFFSSEVVPNNVDQQAILNNSMNQKEEDTCSQSSSDKSLNHDASLMHLLRDTVHSSYQTLASALSTLSLLHPTSFHHKSTHHHFSEDLIIKNSPNPMQNSNGTSVMYSDKNSIPCPSPTPPTFSSSLPSQKFGDNKLFQSNSFHISHSKISPSP